MMNEGYSGGMYDRSLLNAMRPSKEAEICWLLLNGFNVGVAEIVRPTIKQYTANGNAFSTRSLPGTNIFVLIMMRF
jgi:hypothetical protein